MTTPFITFGAPDIQQADIDEVVDSLTKRWLGTGPKVAQFEAAFAAYKGVPKDQVVAVNSCTSALHLALLGAGVGPGDEVITTPLTFCATVNAIIHTGATPVLADIDADTLNISPAAVERQITPRTKALLPVHFAGLPCDIDHLKALATHYKLKLIEDCAHALESQLNGQPCGKLGDFSCFSFYATKNVTTGEGGMLVARDTDVAQRLRRLAHHGLSDSAWNRYGGTGFKHYQVVECGFKYNMMDLQAAIGLHQLARVDQAWQSRLLLWQRYQRALADMPLKLPVNGGEDVRHGLHLYTVQVQGPTALRDQLLDAMAKQGIGVGVHYLSLAEHPYYQQRYGWKPDQWPEAMHVGRRTLSLPLMPQLTVEQQDRVIEALKISLEGLA